MSYIVTAPCVVIRDDRGQHVFYAYQGATVQDLIPEQAEQLLSAGMLRRVGDVQPAPPIVVVEPEAEPQVPA